MVSVMLINTLYNVCSVHWRMFSTSGDTMSTSGDIMSTLGVFSTLGDIMMHVGDIMSTSGDVQYIGGYHEYIRGYHEYIGGCSVHRGDIMMQVGEQVGKNLSISSENPDVLNIQCTHDIPSMYSWYPPDVLNIPQCTHGIPPHASWYSPDVLMTSPRCAHGIPQCTEHPRCTHDIPQCTHGIPDVLNTPYVLNIPWCNEHTLYRMIEAWLVECFFLKQNC